MWSSVDGVLGALQAWRKAYREGVSRGFCVREQHDGTFWAVNRNHHWGRSPYDEAYFGTCLGPFSNFEEAAATAVLMGFSEQTVQER